MNMKKAPVKLSIAKRRILMLCAAMMAMSFGASAQNNRLEPLHGIPSAHIAWYTEMPTQEPVLFSMLTRVWVGPNSRYGFMRPIRRNLY